MVEDIQKPFLLDLLDMLLLQDLVDPVDLAAFEVEASVAALMIVEAADSVVEEDFVATEEVLVEEVVLDTKVVEGLEVAEEVGIVEVFLLQMRLLVLAVEVALALEDLVDSAGLLQVA